MSRLLRVLLLLSFMAWITSGADPYLVGLKITRHDESIAAAALVSVFDLVDAVVLIDTGSNNSVDVAGHVAGDRLIVKQLFWPGNLSEARNKALRMAADLGASWGVFIDTVGRVEGNTTHVKDFLKQTKADLVNMKGQTPNLTQACFHRLPPKGAFVGPAHEDFVLEPGSTQDNIDVPVSASNDGDGLSSRSQLDVAILDNRTMHDPSDAGSWYLLGDAYTATKQHDEAIKAYQHCYEFGESDEEAAIAMYKAATSWVALGRYDNALQALSKGMTRHPAVPELTWFAAYVSYQTGRHQAAADWARLAIVHGCYNGTCPKRTGFENPFARYEGPYDLLKWSLHVLGDSNGALIAERHVQAAIKKRQDGISPTIQDATAQKDISMIHAEFISTMVNGSKPRIGLGFTTAKRPETFKRTYLSFRARCLDCNLIDDWYAVDDGSSDEQLADMKGIAPHIKWLGKPPHESGHVSSINTLLHTAAEYDYFVWMEDDWYFVKDDYLLSKAITVLKSIPDIGQVLFNQDYVETDNEDHAVHLLGGDHYETSGVSYVVHKYCGAWGTEGYQQCSQPGKVSNYHWPHFSLRPGVWGMAHITPLGPLEAGDNFEYVHAHKYAEHGLKTAFLQGASAVHLGRPTSKGEMAQQHFEATLAKHNIFVPAVGRSAYDLTGTHR